MGALRELINIIGFEVDEQALSNVQNRTKSAFEGIKDAALRLAIPAAGMLAVHEFTKYNVALAEIRQRLISTGNTAKKTVGELDELSNKLAEGTNISHDDILEAEGTLLKFGKISGEVYDRATKAAVDFAAANRMDVTSAVHSIGRALESPGDSLRMLKMQGVAFTDAEVEMLKALDASGRSAEAQVFILGRLERSLGGTAKAIHGASSGFEDMKKMQEEVFEEFGKIITPYVKKFYQIVTAGLEWVKNLDDSKKKTITLFAAIIAGAIGVQAALAPVMAFVVAFGWWIPIIGAALAVVALIVEDIITWVDGGDSLLKDFFTGWIPDAAKAFTDFIKMIKEGILSIPVIGDVIHLAAKTFKGVGDPNSSLAFDSGSLGRSANWNNLAPSTTNNKSNKITTQNTINVKVPAGTTKEQADYMAKAVDSRIAYHTRAAVNGYTK